MGTENNTGEKFVQRYDIHYEHEITQKSDGRFVTYEAYDRLRTDLGVAKTQRGHAEAEMINGIKENQQLQVELAAAEKKLLAMLGNIRNLGDENRELCADVIAAYNRGYVRGLQDSK